jgi:nucleoside-diphosphate-sugar epimerase
VALRRLLQPRAALPDVSTAWVDVRDVAAAAVAVLARPPAGRYLLSAHWEPWRATAARLDRLTGRSRRRIWFPHSVVRAVAAVNERAGGRLIRDVPSPAAVEFILTLGRVDGSSGLPALGLAYRDFDASLQDTLQWWAANGVVAPREVGRLRTDLGGEG